MLQATPGPTLPTALVGCGGRLDPALAAGFEGYAVSRAPHDPVLLAETLEWLAPQPGRVFVDGTLGAGGHTEALLERVGPTGRVLGIDRDPAARELAGERLARFGDAFVAIAGNHDEIVALTRDAGYERIDGALFDLGVSSMQIDTAERGFSFMQDGPLDMRMNPAADTPTAADLVNSLSNQELGRLLRTQGEERRAAAIAKAIVRARERTPLTRTRQLAEIIEQAAGPAARAERIHPATRTFQALRIAVNGELEYLERLVDDAVELLNPGGRVVVISYHSLEDRAIKHRLRGLANRCTCPKRLPVCACGNEDLVRVLTPRPVRPGDEEVARNPRARSARLRAAERLGEPGEATS